MACKRCEGKGRTFSPDQYGISVSVKCPVCQGSGRVKVQSKVITRVEPFVPGKDDTEMLTM
nr:molecular chaperone DnaJ [Bacteroides sp.]